MLKRLVLIPLTLAAVLLLGASPMSLGPGSGADGTGYTPSVLLPDTILVAVDRQLNVWYDAMSPRFFGTAPTGWLAYADSGRCLDRSWRWTPTAAKTQALTIRPVDVNGALGAATTAIVQAVAEDAGAITGNILFIGDSLLASADSTAEESDNLVISNVDSLFEADTAAGDLGFIGTQGVTHPGEGRSGYTTARYTQSYDANGHHYNPFWDRTNERVSFRYYLTDRSLTGPIDYGVIMLGWNDIYAIGGANATTAQIDAIVARLDTLVSVLKDPTGLRGFADCRVYVCTIPMGAISLSAWGTATQGQNYKDEWPYWQANAQRLNKAIIKRFDDDGTYSDSRGQVDVIPVHLWVDRTYGYPYSSLAVSARNRATAMQHSNYLHPNATGKYQESDAMYSALRHGFAMQNPINLLSESELFGTWTMTGSPAWVGWAACTVTDVDSAAGQVWSYTTDTQTYFELDTTGLKVADSNCLSYYIKRQGSGVSVSTQIYVNLASGTDPYCRYLINDANSNGVISRFSTTYGGTAYGGANADSSYKWHRCTNTPSGWLRFSFSFDHMQDESTDLSGTAISSVRVYINAVGAGYTGSQVSITGVQFAQGTRRPDVYVPKP